MGVRTTENHTKFMQELEEKVSELIDSIRLYGPVVITNKDYCFKDGRTYKSFYSYLKREYNRYNKKQKLTQDEIFEKNCVVMIDEELEKNRDICPKEDKKSKIEEEQEIELLLKKVIDLKKTIILLNKIPSYVDKDNEELYYFEDGTSKRSFYFKLKDECSSLIDKKSLTEIEKLKLKSFKEISDLFIELQEKRKQKIIEKESLKKNKRIDNYNNSILEKTKILIDVIEKYKFIPIKEQNPDLPYAFEDGVKYITFYTYLRSKHNYLTKKADLTETEKVIKESFELINKQFDGMREENVVNVFVSNSVIIKKSMDLIDTILEINRLPKKKEKNDGKSEYSFEDGIDKRTFFDMLKAVYPSLKKKESKTARDYVMINCYENISWNIGFIHLRNYLEQYGDLNIINGYISKLGDNRIELRKWFDIQKKKYKIIEKSNIQLEHENMLNNLYPNWYQLGGFDVNKILNKNKKN